MTLPSRLGCSTISFQHLPLHEALIEISGLGFTQVDLGALPGVCDHVPEDLTNEAIAEIAAVISESGLAVRSVNGDAGDLNAPRVQASVLAQREAHLDQLLALTARIGATALVLPCASLGHDPFTSVSEDLERSAAALSRTADRAHAHGIEVWVESLHYLRLCFNRERADYLHELLASSDVRPVLDLAHVTAAGDDLLATLTAWADQVSHVHVRDAKRGEFNAPFGDGDIDFAAAVAALDAAGFTGTYALELPSAAYQDDAPQGLDASARLAKTQSVARAAQHMSELIAPFDSHPRSAQNPR